MSRSVSGSPRKDRSPSPRGRDRDRSASASMDKDRSSRGRGGSRSPSQKKGKTQRGVCKWFSNEKGFGFIVPDDGRETLFVHQSQVFSEGYRSLAEGEKVEFRIKEERDGRLRAVDVTGPGGAYCMGTPRGSDERDNSRSRSRGRRDYGGRGRSPRRGYNNRRDDYREDRGRYGRDRDRSRSRDRGYGDRNRY